MPACVFVQARMGSSRLPGKVLRQLGARPVLEHVVRRARQAVSQVVVLTSDRSRDDAIARYCRDTGTQCVRGPEDDVLERFRRAAAVVDADVIVRLTADNPFIDPAIVTACMTWHRAAGVDLSSTRVLEHEVIVRRTAPPGMSVDVIRTTALEEAARYASTPFQREHVIPVFFDAGVFRVSLIDLGLDRASLACSFSIDTEDDAKRAEHLLSCAGEDADLAALVAAGAKR